MRFERLLLLWDELDELTGAIRHSALHLAHGLNDLRQDVAVWVASWTTANGVTSAEALPEVSPET